MKNNLENSALVFLRHSDSSDLLVVANFTPIPRENYRVGVPQAGRWVEIMNTDAAEYGGSGRICTQPGFSEVVASHGQTNSIQIGLAPLSVAFWKRIEE